MSNSEDVRQQADTVYTLKKENRALSGALKASLRLEQEANETIATLTKVLQAMETAKESWQVLYRGQLQRSAILTEALENVHEYLHATLAPCEPDCECVLHTVKAALRQET